MTIQFIVCDHISYHNYVENVMWNYFYLAKRKKPFTNIYGQFFIDSGGFTCKGKYPPLKEYMKTIEIMNPDIFACQDLMCEPHFLKITGLSLNTHLEKTVESYLNIMEYISQNNLDIGYCIPVLQGWELHDYIRCIDLYKDYGFSLDYCAVGSTCLRPWTSAQSLIFYLSQILPKSIFHGFGVNRAIHGYYSRDTALSKWCKMNYTTKNGLHSILYKEQFKGV